MVLQAVLGIVKREFGALGIDSVRAIHAADLTLRSFVPGGALMLGLKEQAHFCGRKILAFGRPLG